MGKKLDKRNVPLRCGSTTPHVYADPRSVVCNAVCVDGRIVHATADTDRMLTLFHVDTAGYLESGRLTDLNDWHWLSPKAALPAEARSMFLVDGAISTVTVDGDCYVFWRSPDRAFRALRLSFGDKTSVKVATVEIGDASLGADRDIPSNLAAFRIPGGGGLDGKIGMVALAQLAANAPSQLVALVLDPSAFVANGTWRAENHSGGLHPNLDAPQPLVSDGYTRLAAGYIDQGALVVAAGDSPQRYATLVVCCASENPGKPLRSYGVPLFPTIDAVNQLRQGFVWQANAIRIEEPGDASDGTPATLCNAPDGTLQAKFVDPSGHARTAALVPNRCQPGDPNQGKPGLYSPAWIPVHADPDGQSPSVASQTTPCSVFLPLPARVTTSPCEVPDPATSGTRLYPDCKVQAYVECEITTSNAQPMLSTFYWGDVFLVPEYATADILDPSRETLLVNLVADSFPYPVPDKRVWGSDSPSGMVNWLLCSYEYLVSGDSTQGLQSSLSGSVGFKFSSSYLVAGVGGQIEASDATGLTSISETEDTRHAAMSYSVTTKGLPIELAGVPSHGNDAELYISREGAAFCTTPVSRVAFDLVASRPREAAAITGPTLVKGRPVLTSPPTAISADYATYCYSPGDLASYQEQRINSRMRELFSALDEDAQRDFVINGEDFRGFYTGSDYLNRIVSRFGTPCFGPSGDRTYLEFSFSETSITRGEYQETSGFKDTGGWYFDDSLYGGLLIDEEVEAEVGFLGIVSVGVKATKTTFSLLIGGEISGSDLESSGQSDSWGVSLGEYLNPLAQGEAYTTRMYFLKPSPLWARELRHFGFPATGYPSLPSIDLKNSAPVRVLFTVPYLSDTLRARLA